LDLAEDRGRFSELLTDENSFPTVQLPKLLMSALADTLDFPLLIRPSYVLVVRE
jgi:carbamoyl-phosphate synthase large subunit